MATSATPTSTATGIARRLVLWAIVNGKSKKYPNLVCWNRMRASGSQALLPKQWLGAPNARHTSKERQLDGFS